MCIDLIIFISYCTYLRPQEVRQSHHLKSEPASVSCDQLDGVLQCMPGAFDLTAEARYVSKFVFYWDNLLSVGYSFSCSSVWLIQMTIMFQPTLKLGEIVKKDGLH